MFISTDKIIDHFSNPKRTLDLLKKFIFIQDRGRLVSPSLPQSMIFLYLIHYLVVFGLYAMYIIYVISKS